MQSSEKFWLFSPEIKDKVKQNLKKFQHSVESSTQMSKAKHLEFI